MADGAQLHVFEHAGQKHLAQFYALSESDLGTAADDGTVPVWKHIASIGEYKGHPSGGFKFDAGSFDEIIKNFQLRETPLNVDYEHQTFNRALKGPIDSAGWIVHLELRDDGQELWALLNLLPDAAELVRGKKIRQCSPVIVPEGTDRESAEDIGFELRSLALTNDPFLDGLHPFQLTRVATMTAEEQKKADEEAAKAKADEAKKLAADGGGDTGGGAAQSLIEALASAAGSDVDTVIAVLSENQDMLVKAVQDAIEKGGTPAENSTNREMRAMTITIGPVPAPKGDAAKALKLEVDAEKGRVRKLTEELTTVKAELSGFVKAKAAAEAAALEAKCKKLQDDGFVAKGEQALKDAIELYRTQPEIADRIYAMQVPPTGLEGGDTDPERESGTDGKPLLMTQLTDIQHAEFKALRGYGKSEKDALLIIAKEAAARAATN